MDDVISEDYCRVYQDLISKECEKIDLEEPDLSNENTFLSQEEIESACNGVTSTKELRENNHICKYGNDQYRTFHLDLIYRLIKIRNREQRSHIPLEHIIDRKSEPVPDFGKHDLKGLLSDLDSLSISDDHIEKFASVYEEKDWFEGLSSHQKPIVKNLIKGSENNVGIAAPTAAGKTLAFFLPSLLKGFQEKVEGKEGTSSLFIYPRKALAKDQFSNFLDKVDRLNKYLEKLDKKPITIGIEDADSREFKIGEEYRGVKCISDNCESKLIVKERGGKEIVECSGCGRSYSYIVPSYDAIAEREPTLLLTNIYIVYRRLLRQDAVQRYENVRYIVMDEAHVYTHYKGGHVSYILKMLRHAASQSREDPIFTFSSATMPNPREFICDLADIEKEDLLFIPYEETLKESEAETPQRTLLRLYMLPNPEYHVETLNQALILASALWCHKHDMKGINFIDSVSEIHTMRSYLKDTILSSTGRDPRMGREVTDHLFNTNNIPENDYSWTTLAPNERTDDLNSFRDFVLGEFKDSIQIHYGGMNRRRRAEVEENFEKSVYRLILSTSTLELGIDLSDVGVIIQYKLPPFSKEGVIQRVGRSGRDKNCLRVGLGIIALSSSPTSSMYIYDRDLRKKLEDVVHLPPSQIGKTGSIQIQHVLSLALFKRAIEGRDTYMRYEEKLKTDKEVFVALEEIESELKSLDDFNEKLEFLPEEDFNEHRDELVNLIGSILSGDPEGVAKQEEYTPENLKSKVEQCSMEAWTSRNKMETDMQNLTSIDSLPKEHRESLKSFINPLRDLTHLLRDLQDVIRLALDNKDTSIIQEWMLENSQKFENTIENLPSSNEIMKFLTSDFNEWMNNQFGGIDGFREETDIDYREMMSKLLEGTDPLVENESENLKSRLKTLPSELNDFIEKDLESISTFRALENFRAERERSRFGNSLTLFEALNAMLQGEAQFSPILSPPQPDFEMEVAEV